MAFPILVDFTSALSEHLAFCWEKASLKCAVCCLARNTYLIRAGLTPQLTLLISIVSSCWSIFHCARLAGYRTGFFYFPLCWSILPSSHSVLARSSESPSDLANLESAGSPGRDRCSVGKRCHPCLCSSRPDDYRNRIASPARPSRLPGGDE